MGCGDALVREVGRGWAARGMRPAWSPLGSPAHVEPCGHAGSPARLWDKHLPKGLHLSVHSRLLIPELLLMPTGCWPPPLPSLSVPRASPLPSCHGMLALVALGEPLLGEGAQLAAPGWLPGADGVLR